MPNLKDLGNRKKSIQATKKITLAMKLIAASKLRRAQVHVHDARPYAHSLSKMLSNFLAKEVNMSFAPTLLTGRRPIQTHLIVVISSNRGLCGGFNSSIVRHVKRLIHQDESEHKKVIMIYVGHKGYEHLKRNNYVSVHKTFDAFDKPTFQEALLISDEILHLFEKNMFDKCTLVYNHFISALNQQVTSYQLIPHNFFENRASLPTEIDTTLYEYEPSQEIVLSQLTLQNIRIQIYMALLENAASEQGARMAAMDAASRNASEMIKALDLKYNRLRQAYITKELIEIISGAEAIK